MMKAKISEIFLSVQGEGPYVGQRQVFVRFAQCNTNCVYCDTSKNMSYKEFDAPELLKEINRLNSSDTKNISLTGGEPLLWTDFLKEFLPFLKENGFKIYLETNGILHANLAKIIDFIDIVAMDIKLPSSTKATSFWGNHKKFMAIAANKKSFVKVVMTKDTILEDIEKMARMVNDINPSITLILQPVTENKNVKGIDFESVFDMQNILSRHLKDVRIIPQVHKIMRAR